ncbi:somatic embryogenesis receptor-like kinase 1 [Striga asiatica]|uniref:Somatic embryogenesis receptor-like kinase 1 n=1 Tax=Striga asiatica TaxID=4170 RepID=A0A5A7PIR7_STRAF|nr:somatic embryogenesis receptor-like kinase 1 [Striga asiatica]
MKQDDNLPTPNPRLAVAPIIASTSAPNCLRLLRSGQELTPVLDLSVEGVELAVGGAAFPCTRFTIKAQQIFVSLSIKICRKWGLDKHCDSVKYDLCIVAVFRTQVQGCLRAFPGCSEGLFKAPEDDLPFN